MPAPKRALIVLMPGFEEVEAITPIDLLRRAGLDVTIASLDGSRLVTGRTNITVQADIEFNTVAGRDFDAVILPGGPGVKHLRAAPAVGALAKRHAEAGRIVAAICAAPTVLHDAGLLAGRRHTAHFSVASELPDMINTEAVVQDGNIITSRGAGTALRFALALITALVSAEAAKQVAASICHHD